MISIFYFILSCIPPYNDHYIYTHTRFQNTFFIIYKKLMYPSQIVA
jgi:hypothetical protein